MCEMLGVKGIDELERHACKTGCTSWPTCSAAEWEQHKDDQCSVCKGLRFKKVLGKLVPVRVSIYAVALRFCIIALAAASNDALRAAALLAV
jgi:hypothetical protein